MDGVQILVRETAELVATVNRLDALCIAHGKPRGQDIASFVNELAKNLRSANDELEDIAEAAERLGYDRGDTVAAFLDAMADAEADFDAEPTFNDCTFNVYLGSPAA